MKKYSIFTALLVLFALLGACRYKLKELQIPKWSTDMLAPLVHTELSVADLIPDSLEFVDTDGTISIVYKQNIFNLPIDSILDIPDTAITYPVTIDSLKLNKRTIVHPISLGTIALGCGCPEGALIIAANGSSTIIPPLTGLSSGDFDINADDFFETADIKSGYLDMTIENGFPIDLTNTIFQIRNKVDGAIIVQDTFSSISAGQITPVRTYDLAGKHVEGSLIGNVLNMDSPGSASPVMIDTSDAIIVTMTARDIHLNGATAIFPSQDLINNADSIVYNMPLGARLKRIDVKSGKLKVKVTSSIEEQMNTYFSMPTVKFSGNPVAVNVSCPPASPGNPVTVEEIRDLNNYSITLDTFCTGSNDTCYWNTFPRILVVSIDSSGIVRTITLNDTISITYELIDIEPAYIEGYLGRDSIQLGPDNISLDFFRIFKTGILDLQNPTMDIVIKNSVGMNNKFTTNYLTGKNTSQGTQVSFTGPSIGNPVTVPGPTLSQVGQVIETRLKFDKTNSNIMDVFKKFPDRIDYAGNASVNFDGDSSYTGLNNFSTDSSYFSADAEVSLPLNGFATDLILADTLAFRLESSGVGRRVKEGTFKMIVESWFPVNAELQAYFTDASGKVIDSLFTSGLNNRIDAGKLDGNNIVVSFTKTTLSIFYSAERMEKIRSAAFIVPRAKLNSIPPGTHVKILNTYKFDLKLVGDFKYVPV